MSVSTKSGSDLYIAVPTSISADGTAVVFESTAEYLLKKKDPSFIDDVFLARF